MQFIKIFVVSFLLLAIFPVHALPFLESPRLATLRSEMSQIDTCEGCGPIYAIAWSHDGQQFVFADRRGIRLYDEQMKLQAWLSRQRTLRIAWSHDDKLLASVHNSLDSNGDTVEYTLRVLNLADSQPMMHFVTPKVIDISWDPDENVLAYTNDKTINLWDADTATTRTIDTIPSDLPVVMEELGYLWWVAWVPTGDQLAVGTGNFNLYMLDSETGAIQQQVIQRQSTALLWRSSFYGPSVAWDPQGERLMITSLAQDMAILFDATTGTLSQRELYIGDRPTGWFVNFFAWSPDGQLLATDGPSSFTFTLWDTTTWKQVAISPPNEAQLSALAWSPDGSHLAVGYHNGSVHFWSRTLQEETNVIRGE